MCDDYIHNLSSSCPNLNREAIKIGFQKAIKLANLSESLSRNKFKIIESNPLICKFKIITKKELS